MKEKLLKTPQGAESIFLDEAYKHERINETINHIYTQWGYLPIKTPVFDYYETYEKLLSEQSKKSCFRLMDRDGELLLLRNDITLFLARQIGRVTRSSDIMRVHYADTILRHQSEIDISSNEFFQTGAELVGAKGINGDLEAITLLHKIISELNLSETKIHIGSRSLLNGILKNFENIDKNTIIDLIYLRDVQSMKTYLCDFMDIARVSEIIEILFFIGNFEEYKQLINNKQSLISILNIKEEFDYLKKIGDNLEKIKLINSFRFDLSEVGERSYYTGVVFQAYTPDIDSAVASGGRYDKLISSFGETIPSVGFSILLRKIEEKIIDEKFNPPFMHSVEIESEFSEAYSEAEKLRKDGKCVIIGENK